MKNWQTHINDSRDLLLSLSVRDKKGQYIDTDTAFKQLQNYALCVLERRKTIYFIGNGSSASIADYASAILAKKTELHTETFYNFALITAITSDSSYDDIFAKPLRKRMTAGDMLVDISNSGESQNIINAVQESLNIGGNICTLSACNPENTLRSMGTINFYIPAYNPRNANQCHMGIINCWIDAVVSTFSWQEEIKNSVTYITVNMKDSL